VLKDGESPDTAPGGAVYDDGVLRITETRSPPGLAIAGEIDESTYPALVRTLKEGVGVAREVHFNLAGVEYCDLAGLRAIILLAGAEGGYRTDGSDGQGGADGRRLVLHEVPPQLRTVLRIVGWDATPGLVID
jgi:ABC-type transporter Mla MlaB component